MFSSATLSGGFLSANGSLGADSEEIAAVILVGSQAKGNATPDSDIDLVILCQRPQKNLENATWAQEFGEIERSTVEDWGKVKSLRAWFASGLEVEFGLTSEDWIAKPLDEDTRIVLRDGFKVLFDRDRLSANLQAELT